MSSNRDSDSTPSWLKEENINAAATVASNPVAQSAASSMARNPAVQSAALDAAKGNGDSWTTKDHDLESSSSSRPDTKHTDEFFVDEVTLAEMGKYHLVLRILYGLAATLMAIAAALSLQNQTNIGKGFFAVYTMIFCLLICCFELGLSAIARTLAVNFGFLYTLHGRIIFILFLGFMAYGLSLFGIITMACLYAVLVFHLYIMYRFPKFEEYLRRKHYYEGKRSSANTN